jgi:hypothetical protein
MFGDGCCRCILFGNRVAISKAVSRLEGEMTFLAGFLLVSLSGFSLWLARARDGNAIPLMRSEFVQITFVMCIVMAGSVGVALLIIGLPEATWR